MIHMTVLHAGTCHAANQNVEYPCLGGGIFFSAFFPCPADSPEVMPVLLS